MDGKRGELIREVQTALAPSVHLRGALQFYWPVCPCPSVLLFFFFFFFFFLSFPLYTVLLCGDFVFLHRHSVWPTSMLP